MFQQVTGERERQREGGDKERERATEGENTILVQKWKGSTQWLLRARDTFDPVTCFELQPVSRTCTERGDHIGVVRM